jgi:putative copper resistance protein D
MPHSAYGILLLAKVGVFIGMLGLAAANRFHLTPALSQGLASGQPASAIAELRRSVFLETAAGLSILVLVGILGTLAPIAAQ